jgi:outer membrane protein assembly factor BamB
MRKLRRLPLLAVVFGLLAALPALLTPMPAAGRGGKQPSPELKGGAKFSAIKLIENDAMQRAIDLAVVAVSDGAWDDAADYLDQILNAPEDCYARVDTIDAKGEKKSRWSSVKFEANNLIGSMPPEGLNVYEVKFGGDARKLLNEAKETGNRQLLGKVAFIYRHTKAGAEANDILGTTMLDRGEYFNASLQFERLLGSDLKKTRVSDLLLFKAALAFKMAGDRRADDVVRILEDRVKANGGLKLAGPDGAVLQWKQVEAALEKFSKPVAAINIHDSPVVWGNLAHNAQSKGSPPMLDVMLWSRQTLMDKSEDTGEVQPGAEAKPYLERALTKTAQNPNMPVMPGGFPVTAGGILFYRTYDGVAAVYLKDQIENGQVVAKAGSIHFRSTPFEGSLGVAMTNGGIRGTMDGWINNVYDPSGFINLLFENSVVGTLTTDNRNVYAVDDLAVPIPPKYLLQQFYNQANFVNDAVKPLVMQNSLWAFDAASGKIAWKLGSSGTDANKSDEFANTHFLCAPVSVGGKLYVLNEKNNGDLRLVCVDPIKGTLVGPMQKLGTVKKEHVYYHDIARRVNAIHLGYAEGILVCPTNAGEILGVDLLSGTLAWAYPYRQKPANPNAFPKQQFEQFPTGAIALSYSNWKPTPPVLTEGKVVFTAPDSNAVHCISLRDGTELWTAPQLDSDLFLAGVFGDKVVIVGKNSVRAVRLSDGAPIWQHLATGDLPSGQGVASNNIYYLPLKKGEILAIDLEKWQVKAHNRAAKPGSPAPGNLVFYEGLVISQTPTAIVAYPQLSAKLAEAELAYKNSATPEHLLALGELRLADGQVHLAVDDLQAVLKLKLEPKDQTRAKNRLYEALSDLLQVDFDKAAPKYLEQYRELCKVPDNPGEEVQRETKYYKIVAQGREAQGDLVSAFVAYKEYGASPLFKDAGIPSVEDPLYKVPVHLWLRGRIGAMFDKANAQQKGALEKKIAEEWTVVKEKKNLDAIRHFTGMFDVPFAVGREARLELATEIIKQADKNAYLEAELNLQQLRVPAFRKDPAIGGKALDALAQLEMARGTDDSMRLAASYFREIYKEFPKDVIRNGKTGAELFNAMAEDKRLQPYLSEPGPRWADAEVKYRQLNGGNVQGIQGFVFQPTGDLTSLMEQHRLVFDPQNQNNPVLRFVDMANNKERWAINLGASNVNYQFFSFLYDQTNRPMGFHPDAHWRFFHVKGHIGVVQIGMVAYGVDLAAGKKLWEHVLYDPNKMQPNFGWSVTTDEHGRLWVLHNTQFGQTRAAVGQVGTVQATYVALVTQKGLVVVDPIKGTQLWSKAGISINTEVFGDDQNLYYVETAEGAAVGAGRALRASDGAHVDVPDFGYFYRNKLRIVGGRYIVTAEPLGKALTMRLYDCQTGKDEWKRTFEGDPVPLHTEEWYYAGVIERTTGKLIVVDLRTQKEVVTAKLLQYRVTADDLKELGSPLFLDDGERYYVALNQKMPPNRVSNNFGNGTRCLPVNGWFIALDRKGEFLWHGDDHYMNQMIVVEQFQNLPVLLFTSRFMDQTPQGGIQFTARTGSVSKQTGKVVKWTPPRMSNGNAQYYTFNVDLKSRTINMIGYSTIDQWYVDEGQGPKKGGAQQQQPAPQAGPQPAPQADPQGRGKLPPQIQVEPLPPAGGRLNGAQVAPQLPVDLEVLLARLDAICGSKVFVFPAALAGDEERAMRDAYICRTLAPREGPPADLAKK